MISIINAEAVKNLAEIKRYLMNEIGYLVEDCIFYGGILLALHATGGGMQHLLHKLMAIVLWQAAGNNSLCSALRSEARNGTLEQLYLTGQPPQLIFWIGGLIRAGVNSLRALLILLPAALLLGGLNWLSVLSHVRWSVVLLAFILSSIGMFGLTLLLASFSFVTRNVQVFSTVLDYYLFFFGALQVGKRVGLLARYFPITLASQSISRAVFAPEASHGEVLFKLAAASLIWTVIGCGVFYKAERLVRKQGGLNKF